MESISFYFSLKDAMSKIMKVLNFSTLWFLTEQIGCRVCSGLVSEGKQPHFYEVIPWRRTE